MNLIDISEVQTLQLEITSHCNAKCPQCSHNDPNTGHLASYLTLKHWETDTILSNLEIEKMPLLRYVIIEGDNGDALMHPDFERILAHFYDAPQNPYIIVITNGTPRTPNWWYNIGKRFNDTDRVRFQFSVDGTEETHHLYRVDLKYETLDANIRAFINGGGGAVQRSIIFKHNQHELQKIQDQAKERGMLALQFIPNDVGRFWGQDHWQVWNRGKQMHQIYPTTLSEKEISSYSYGKMENSAFDKRSTRHTCPNFRQGLVYVTYQGHVIPGCCVHTMLYFDAPQNKQFQGIAGDISTLDLNMHTLDHVLSTAPMLRNLNDNLVSGDAIQVCVQTCNFLGKHIEPDITGLQVDNKI